MSINYKQQKSIARNARLNYLVDQGMEAEKIKGLMPNYKITLNFINNIIAKRGRAKALG